MILLKRALKICRKKSWLSQIAHWTEEKPWTTALRSMTWPNFSDFDQSSFFFNLICSQKVHKKIFLYIVTPSVHRINSVLFFKFQHNKLWNRNIFSKFSENIIKSFFAQTVSHSLSFLGIKIARINIYKVKENHLDVYQIFSTSVYKKNLGYRGRL